MASFAAEADLRFQDSMVHLPEVVPGRRSPAFAARFGAMALRHEAARPCAGRGREITALRYTRLQLEDHP